MLHNTSSSDRGLYATTVAAFQLPHLMFQPPPFHQLDWGQHQHPRHVHHRPQLLACPVIYQHHQITHSGLKANQPGSGRHPPSGIKKNTPSDSGDSSSSTTTPTAPQRRRTKRMFSDRACGNCDTHFTSQWRTGPSGPSTLCNACGIRYARQSKLGQKRQVSPMDSPQPSSDEEKPQSPRPPLSPPFRSSVHFLLN